MAEEKKSFVAYADWNATFEKLTDEEAGRLSKMIFAYVNDLNPEYPDRLTELLFQPIKQCLKRDLRKYESVKSDRSNAGRIGNLKRYNSDLYDSVVSGNMTIDDAENLAKLAMQLAERVAAQAEGLRNGRHFNLFV